MSSYSQVNQDEVPEHDDSIEVKPQIRTTSVLSSTTLSASQAGRMIASLRQSTEPHAHRNSHFDALIQQARQNQPRYTPSSPRIAEEENEDEGAAEQQQQEEEKDPDEGHAAARPKMGRTESTFFDIGDKYLQFKAQVGNDRLVQVNLRNFSYHVPVKMDAPSIKTVLNQSVCYMTFEFFRRVHYFCQRNKSEDGEQVEADTPDWEANSTSDLFLPFDKKPILKDLTLCFEPGKTYLILAPPGQ